MITKILPILFLLIGAGVGIGAGAFFSPDVEGTVESGEILAEESEETTLDEGVSEIEFVKLSNQFVIPVIEDDSIVALVVVSLSLEVRGGTREGIYAREPKLRDSFLRVLFDHANMGGFHGEFTRNEMMEMLRTALREVAQNEIGPSVLDVLISDIIRQDT